MYSSEFGIRNIGMVAVLCTVCQLFGHRELPGISGNTYAGILKFTGFRCVFYDCTGRCRQKLKLYRVNHHQWGGRSPNVRNIPCFKPKASNCKPQRISLPCLPYISKVRNPTRVGKWKYIPAITPQIARKVQTSHRVASSSPHQP